MVMEIIAHFPTHSVNEFKTTCDDQWLRLECKTVTTTVNMTVSEKTGYSAQILNF